MKPMLVLASASPRRAELLRNAGISFALARLLVGRSITADALQDALNPTLKRLMPDPLVLLNMDKAVARAKAAVENGEHIAIFGSLLALVVGLGDKGLELLELSLLLRLLSSLVTGGAPLA